MQDHESKMLDSERCKEFKKFIIDKHKIDLSRPIEFTNGEKHVMSCSDDQNAYIAYLKNRFFSKEKASAKVNFEAKELISKVIKQVTGQE